MDKIVFTLQGKELEDATAWKLTHACALPFRVPGAPPGYEVDFNYKYIFTPCGPGMAVSIRCGRCGKTKNVTDYDAW